MSRTLKMNDLVLFRDRLPRLASIQFGDPELPHDKHYLGQLSKIFSILQGPDWLVLLRSLMYA